MATSIRNCYLPVLESSKSISKRLRRESSFPVNANHGISDNFFKNDKSSSDAKNKIIEEIDSIYVLVRNKENEVKDLKDRNDELVKDKFELSEKFEAELKSNKNLHSIIKEKDMKVTKLTELILPLRNKVKEHEGFKSDIIRLKAEKKALMEVNEDIVKEIAELNERHSKVLLSKEEEVLKLKKMNGYAEKRNVDIEMKRIEEMKERLEDEQTVVENERRIIDEEWGIIVRKKLEIRDNEKEINEKLTNLEKDKTLAEFKHQNLVKKMKRICRKNAARERKEKDFQLKIDNFLVSESVLKDEVTAKTALIDDLRKELSEQKSHLNQQTEQYQILLKELNMMKSLIDKGNIVQDASSIMGDSYLELSNNEVSTSTNVIVDLPTEVNSENLPPDDPLSTIFLNIPSCTESLETMEVDSSVKDNPMKQTELENTTEDGTTITVDLQHCRKSAVNEFFLSSDELLLMRENFTNLENNDAADCQGSSFKNTQGNSNGSNFNLTEIENITSMQDENINESNTMFIHNKESDKTLEAYEENYAKEEEDVDFSSFKKQVSEVVKLALGKFLNIPDGIQSLADLETLTKTFSEQFSTDILNSYLESNSSSKGIVLTREHKKTLVDEVIFYFEIKKSVNINLKKHLQADTQEFIKLSTEFSNQFATEIMDSHRTMFSSLSGISLTPDNHQWIGNNLSFKMSQQ